AVVLGRGGVGDVVAARVGAGVAVGTADAVAAHAHEPLLVQLGVRDRAQYAVVARGDHAGGGGGGGGARAPPRLRGPPRRPAGGVPRGARARWIAPSCATSGRVVPARGGWNASRPPNASPCWSVPSRQPRVARSVMFVPSTAVIAGCAPSPSVASSAGVGATA